MLKEKKAQEEEVTHSRRRNRIASWPELPTDIIELILKKLPSIVDIVRFKVVCPLWNFAATSYISSPNYTPPSPWLMFRVFRKNNEYAKGRRATHLFDPVEEKLYKIKSVNDDFPYAEIVGSSHGWLVILDRGQSLPPLKLFNPISRATIPLPNLWDTISDNYSEPKAIISSNPFRNENALVAVLLRGSIPLCKQEDKAWTMLAGVAIHSYTYADIVFHNNQLFGLVRWADGSLDVWDCTESVPVKTMSVKGSYTGTNFHRTLLVPSLMGDILRVKRFCVSKNTRFSVEKLNLTLKQWERVESLGNQVLHFNCNQLTSLSIQSILGRENSIYFPDGIYNHGVYSLESNRAVRLGKVKLSNCDRCKYPDKSYHVLLEPFSIVPAP